MSLEAEAPVGGLTGQSTLLDLWTSARVALQEKNERCGLGLDLAECTPNWAIVTDGESCTRDKTVLSKDALSSTLAEHGIDDGYLVRFLGDKSKVRAMSVHAGRVLVTHIV